MPEMGGVRVLHKLVNWLMCASLLYFVLSVYDVVDASLKKFTFAISSADKLPVS